MAGSHEIPHDDAEPSAAQRLVRRVVERVTTRLHERYSEYRDGHQSTRRGICRFTARFQSRFQCRRNEPEPCEEKPPFRKPQRWLVILGATNRVWQFLSAIAFAAAFMTLFDDEIDNARGRHVATEAIEYLAYPAVLFSFSILLVVALSRKRPSHSDGQFSLIAIFLDSFMIWLASCKLSILHSDEALASCRPKATAPYVKSMLNNGAAYAYTRFGWGKAVEPETIDLHCCLPKIVAVLICLVILSYSVSIFLSALFLLRGREAPISDSLPGYIEEAIPVSASHGRPSSTPRVSLTASRHSSSPRPSMAEEEPKYTNLEDVPFPQGRLSQETTSSYNPDHYLVSDGFRPTAQLPGYSSRPPSYRSNRTGPPSYSSRPSSLRNEV